MAIMSQDAALEFARRQAGSPSTGFDWMGLLNAGLPLLTRSTSSPTVTGLSRGAEQLGGLAALSYGTFAQPSYEIPDWGSFATPAGTAATRYLQGAFESPAEPFAPGGT